MVCDPVGGKPNRPMGGHLAGSMAIPQDHLVEDVSKKTGDLDNEETLIASCDETRSEDTDYSSEPVGHSWKQIKTSLTLERFNGNNGLT